MVQNRYKPQDTVANENIGIKKEYGRNEGPWGHANREVALSDLNLVRTGKGFDFSNWREKFCGLPRNDKTLSNTDYSHSAFYGIPTGKSSAYKERTALTSDEQKGIFSFGNFTLDLKTTEIMILERVVGSAQRFFIRGENLVNAEHSNIVSDEFLTYIAKESAAEYAFEKRPSDNVLEKVCETTRVNIYPKAQVMEHRQYNSLHHNSQTYCLGVRLVNIVHPYQIKKHVRTATIHQPEEDRHVTQFTWFDHKNTRTEILGAGIFYRDPFEMRLLK